MKTVLVLRHAKSSWKDSGLDDHDRPLNKRGKGDAPRMGQFLAEQDMTPDLMISSTARRARETAETIAEESGYRDEIEFTETFYLAGPQAYLDAMRLLPETVERVMVVGHNPGLEALVAEMTGDEVTMPTCAVALIRVPVDSWEALKRETCCELAELWKPKAIFEEEKYL